MTGIPLATGFCIVALQLTGCAGSPDLSLTAEVIGDKPMQFQAARLRLSVENVGRLAVSLPAIEYRLRINSMKYEDELETKNRYIYSPLEFGQNAIARKVIRRGLQFMTLAPGERRSVTIPVSLIAKTNMMSGEGLVRDYVPLFSRPGHYTLRCQYLYGTASVAGGGYRELTVEARVVIDVKEGQASDKEWLTAFREQPDLQVVLLQFEKPCSAAHAGLLAALIKRSPKSSYAMYGRLALAYYHHSGGDAQYSGRVNLAMAADYLEVFLKNKDILGFPFMPQTYILLGRSWHDYSHIMSANLYEYCWDSLEWLRLIAPKLKDEEWTQLRQGKPVEAAKTNVLSRER